MSLVQGFERVDGTSKIEVAPAYCHEPEQTGRAFRPSLRLHVTPRVNP